MVVILSLFVNTIFNVFIFKHVRASTHRVQPQRIGTNLITINNQHPRISRRDISLLKQMIFMFCTFIAGWIPPYLLLILNVLFTFNQLIFQYSVVVFELAVLAITINLLICNHEIKEFIINKIRQWVRR